MSTTPDTSAAPALSFDLDSVTPRMLIDFKAATGVSLLSLVDDDGDLDLGSLSEEAIAGVVMIALRTSGQTEASYEQALDTPFTVLTVGEAKAADPT